MALQRITHIVYKEKKPSTSAAVQRQTSNTTTKNKKTEKIEGKDAKLRSDSTTMHQTFLISSQLAFLFVLFLASVNLASANSVCTECGNNTADSASKKVVYNVQIRESGKQYNETIEIDTEKQTELFKVPAQRDAKASNILHDFKKNLSMLLLVEKRVCYLLPLDKELSTPRKLIHDLDGAKRTTSKTTIIESKWTVGSELTDRSVLSVELAAFCENYPIYHAKKLENFITATRIQNGGIRNRRTLYPEIDDGLLCPGGNKLPSAFDVGYCFILYKRWRMDCKEITTCQVITVCPTILTCFEQHLRNTFICCEYVCA